MRNDHFIRNARWAEPVATPPPRPNWWHIVPIVLVGLAWVGAGVVLWVCLP
jgi:hypothetical protein